MVSEIPHQIVQNASDLTVVLVAVTTFTSAAYGLHRYILVPVRDNVRGIYKAMLTGTTILLEIGAQFKNNHGTSLKDSLDRIENTLARNGVIGQVMLQESPDAVFETDADGNCVWVNDTYTDWTGLSVDRASGMGWWEAIALCDRERVAREWAAAVERGTPFTGHYTWTNGRDEFPVRCRVKVAMSQRGELVGCIGLVKRVDTRASMPTPMRAGMAK